MDDRAGGPDDKTCRRAALSRYDSGSFPNILGYFAGLMYHAYDRATDRLRDLLYSLNPVPHMAADGTRPMSYRFADMKYDAHAPSAPLPVISSAELIPQGLPSWSSSLHERQARVRCHMDEQ